MGFDPLTYLNNMQYLYKVVKEPKWSRYRDILPKGPYPVWFHFSEREARKRARKEQAELYAHDPFHKDSQPDENGMWRFLEKY